MKPLDYTYLTKNNDRKDGLVPPPVSIPTIVTPSNSPVNKVIPVVLCNIRNDGIPHFPSNPNCTSHKS